MSNELINGTRLAFLKANINPIRSGQLYGQNLSLYGLSFWRILSVEVSSAVRLPSVEEFSSSVSFSTE